MLTVIGPVVTIAFALVIEIYASVVALAVVLTLLLQALPARRLAARLGLLEPA